MAKAKIKIPPNNTQPFQTLEDLLSQRANEKPFEPIEESPEQEEHEEHEEQDEVTLPAEAVEPDLVPHIAQAIENQDIELANLVYNQQIIRILKRIEQMLAREEAPQSELITQKRVRLKVRN